MIGWSNVQTLLQGPPVACPGAGDASVLANVRNLFGTYRLCCWTAWRNAINSGKGLDSIFFNTIRCINRARCMNRSRGRIIDGLECLGDVVGNILQIIAQLNDSDACIAHLIYICIEVIYGMIFIGRSCFEYLNHRAESPDCRRGVTEELRYLLGEWKAGYQVQPRYRLCEPRGPEHALWGYTGPVV